MLPQVSGLANRGERAMLAPTQFTQYFVAFTACSPLPDVLQWQ